MNDHGSQPRCRITDAVPDRGPRAVRIENDLLAATILVDKGADIVELIYKPREMDVLWKSPWGSFAGTGVRAADSQVAWLESYEGGWQELFPNAGDSCLYKGVELGFHGEASLAGWQWEIVEAAGDAAELKLWTRLRRSPFLLERWMRVEAGRPLLMIRERITNEGGEVMDYMWGHHPAYGAPFLSETCRVDTGARSVRADDLYDGPANPLPPDGRFPWPVVERDGRLADLSQVPGPRTPRQTFAYLHDFAGEHGWYGLTNTALGFGVGFVWPTRVFPYAWFWQEMHATPGFPWYQRVYVMAIEPFSSIPGQGLAAVIEKTGSHRTLAPGQTVEAELRAVFYESRTGIEQIMPDGAVVTRAR